MNYSATFSLLARLGLAAIFIMSGLGKIGGYEGTMGYMESMGVPGILLPAVIALEVLGAAQCQLSLGAAHSLTPASPVALSANGVRTD